MNTQSEQKNPHGSGPEGESSFRSRHEGQPLLAIARLEQRRRRRAIIAWAAVLTSLIAWHVYPYWRMWSLESTILELRHFRDANGRFPLSKTDVKSLAGSDVAYMTDKTGAGFGLRFNHPCLYDLGELRRWDYDSSSDSWFSHAD